MRRGAEGRRGGGGGGPAPVLFTLPTDSKIIATTANCVSVVAKVGRDPAAVLRNKRREVRLSLLDMKATHR